MKTPIKYIELRIKKFFLLLSALSVVSLAFLVGCGGSGDGPAGATGGGAPMTGTLGSSAGDGAASGMDTGVGLPTLATYLGTNGAGAAGAGAGAAGAGDTTPPPGPERDGRSPLWLLLAVVAVAATLVGVMAESGWATGTAFESSHRGSRLSMAAEQSPRCVWWCMKAPFYICASVSILP